MKFFNRHNDEDVRSLSSDSCESIISDISNWTQGRSRQRLKAPESLKDNNLIALNVIEKHSQRLTSE